MTPGRTWTRRRWRLAGGSSRPAQAGRPPRWRTTDALLLGLLAVVGVLTRVFTTNSLAGEPTSDEYLLGLYARELARTWSSGGGLALRDLLSEGRAATAFAAAATMALPFDAITAGRTVQALFNALAVPGTYGLARAVGLAPGAALAAAVVLLAVPDFQENAWRFWTDSQAALLGLVYVGLLVDGLRRSRLGSLLAALLPLAGLFLTKDSAAGTFAPFLPLAALAVLLVRASGRRRWRLAIAVGGAALAAALLAVTASGVLGRLPVLGRVVSAIALAAPSLGAAFPSGVPPYLERLGGLLNATNLSGAFLVAWAAGALALWVRALTAIGDRARAGALLLWLVAAAATTLAGLGSLRAAWQQAPAATAAALVVSGLLLVVAAARERHVAASDLRDGRGFALLSTIVLAFVVQRFALLATPTLEAGIAFTTRTFMPTMPLLAVVGGAGLASVAEAVPGRGPRRVVAPLRAPLRAALPALSALALVVGASPLFSGRLTTTSLLGRPADRGADPNTPQGLRVEALAEAEPWLRRHIRQDSVVLTSIPRHLAWYAGLSPDAYRRVIDLGSQPRTPLEQLAYVMPRVGPTGVDYVVDFNVSWTDPDGEASALWRQRFDWLAGRPNLEIAYLRRDRFGQPVFYVARNRATTGG